MTTDNKKISAYVPDLIYDRFIQFKDERNISMSQAAIEIFAAYFGINLNPTISGESTSELQSRVSMLEKELVGLKNHFVLLSSRVDLIQSTSEPLIDKVVEVPSGRDFIDKSESNLQNELLKDEIIEQPVDINIVNELQSDSDSESPKQLQLIDSTDLLSKLKSNPLEAKILAFRLGVKPPDISIKKGKVSIEEFYNWIQSKDIDGIRWVLIGEGKKARYIPANDTPIDKLQALKEWLQVNT